MMLSALYRWLHKKLSKPEERGEYSAGVWQNTVREQVLSLCAKSSGRILEVGCGEGLFLSKLAAEKKYAGIAGVDIWYDILEKANRRLAGKDAPGMLLTQADAVRLPFQADVFDTVVCINVFFNLASEETVAASIKEVSRVCKSGGVFVFDIRNRRNPLLYWKYKWAKYYDATVANLPLRTYDRKTMRAYLQRYGFVCEEERAIGFPHNAWSPIFVMQARKR